MTTSGLYEVAQELGRLWSMPDLPTSTTIEFSDRMSTSLGRCLPARRLVRLHAGLRTKDEELVREVLSHELAHLVVHVRFGDQAKPHGQEWQHLVSLAGFEPKRRAERVFPHRGRHGVLDTKRRVEHHAPSRHFEHRCPVCQSVRIARTSRARWRCADCVADGLDGTLVISALPLEAP